MHMCESYTSSFKCFWPHDCFNHQWWLRLSWINFQVSLRCRNLHTATLQELSLLPSLNGGRADLLMNLRWSLNWGRADLLFQNIESTQTIKDKVYSLPWEFLLRLFLMIKFVLIIEQSPALFFPSNKQSLQDVGYFTYIESAITTYDIFNQLPKLGVLIKKSAHSLLSGAKLNL